MAAKGVTRTEFAGPFTESPFTNVHLSPFMTVHKRPRDRHHVVDASLRRNSFNNNTLEGLYLGQPMKYRYLCIENNIGMILMSGRVVMCGNKLDISLRK